MCKDKSYMVVAEQVPKLVQLGDQKLCQITRKIKGLKNGDSHTEDKLFYGKVVLR